MRTVSYRIGDLTKATIHLGRVAENDYPRVQIDAGEIYAEYPHAAASLTVQPPAGEAYPAVVTREGDLVIWDVPDSALTEEGMGEIQLTFTDGETVVKSAIGRISVCRSIVGEGEAPDPLEDFLAEAGAALTAIPETIDAALEAAKESGEFDGPAGPARADGADGADGFSPVVTVSEISGGHSVSVTDASGTETFNVMDGVDGQAGTDGYSPSASVTKSGSTATIVITDKDGTTTAQISDGEGADVIDDTSTASDKTWSASKVSGELSNLNSALSAKYEKPSGGIPSTDLADSYVEEPSSEGTNGQVLTTDGNGGRSWQTVESGANIDDTAGSGDTDKCWSADKLTDEFGDVNDAISEINSELHTGSSETVTGDIAVIEGQTAGASIGITPGTGVTNIYHTKKNLFNLFNRTKGTITEYGASSPRNFSETEYYHGFVSTGVNDGDGYGTLDYITDGIALFQGATGGGGGHGTIFPFKIPAEKTYTLSMNIYGEVKVMYYNSSGVFQSNESAMSSTSTAMDKTFTFTPPAGTYWTVFLFQNHKTRNYQYKNVMLVEGESAETYEVCSYEKLANSITSITAYAGINKLWSDAGSFTIDGEVNVLEAMDERIDTLEGKTVPLENDVVHRNLDVLPAVHACVGYGKSVGGVLNSEEGWGMLITTDVHARETVMQNAIDYFNEYPFLHIGMCLGDMAASNYAQTDGTWYTGKVNTATKPWYTVLGNHDGGNSTDGSISATVSDQFTKWIYPTLATMGMPSLTVPYYAVHNSTYGVSAIFLDCYDVPDTKSGSDFVVSRGTSAYSQAQIDWFINELNNVPSGNHLLIFQHRYTGASTKETCAWSQAYKVVNDISSYGELIPDIVNAWVTGGTLSDTYTTSVTGLSSITVSADFTSRGTGVFAGYVVGHYHRDLIAHSTKYTYQKIIALCCTADGTWQGENSDLPRVENTKSQDCLTVLCVNKTRQTVNLARVGANWTISMTQRIGYAVSYATT